MPGIDLDDLLRREGSHIEWKRGVADFEDVVKTLTAFANDLEGAGKGGWVICGVEEADDGHGFPIARRTGLMAGRLREIQGRVLDWCQRRVFPAIVPSADEIPVPEDPARRILIFHVPASRLLHELREENGSTRCWVRYDNRTVEAREDLLRRLRQQKQDLPRFLERPCPGTGLDDLDLVAAEEFLSQAGLPHPAEEYLRPGARLDAFSHPLVVNPAVPTCLAVLLFGREPTRWIPGAYAVFTLYEGADRTATQSTRFQLAGPLPRLILDLLDRLRSHAGVSIDKSASALEIQQNRPRYNLKALQEAVVNAFAHRDYESPEPVRVTVFSDRIEVASPGGLVPGMDAERVRRGDATPLWRNPALASFLLRLHLAQNEGQGLKTIIAETRATAGRDPEILPGPTGFEVWIPAYRPVAFQAHRDMAALGPGRQGLILISIGGPSVRLAMEHSLADLSLEDSEVLVDFSLPDYVSPDTQHWESEAAKIRDQIKGWVEDPQFSRFHLFYRGPVVIAPLLGALIAPAKPLVVYHYEDGRYTPAYTLDRRFLLSSG